MVKFNIKTERHPLFTTDNVMLYSEEILHLAYGNVSQLDKIIYSEENHLTHPIYFLVLKMAGRIIIVSTYVKLSFGF